MREYLYIWHDPVAQFIVASGLEFRSLASYFSRSGGLLLLDHESETAYDDPGSGFEFVPHNDIAALAAEDIYSWGDFTWVDYESSLPPQFPPPAIPPEEVAELLYFAHTAKPLRSVRIPSLRNRFLCYAHDDGWVLHLHYTAWLHVEEMLRLNTTHRIGVGSMGRLRSGSCGLWIENGVVNEEEMSFDVASIINRHVGR